MDSEQVSADFPYESHYCDVLGSKMHYISQGSGDPIVFLHGVPASSYLWRNIIPYLAPLGRCIAVDLIGFGKSDKPDIEYSIKNHIQYVEQFIKKLNLKNITLVLHGFGSIAGLEYAMHHEDNCKGLVFYEAYLRPSNSEDLSFLFQEQMVNLNESVGEILTNGAEFIDKVLPQAMMRTLTETEMSFYRTPFLDVNASKPLLKYFRELPEVNNATNQVISEYSKKLTQSNLPKLMLYSIPGYITSIATVMWAKSNLLNLEVSEVGEALHYAQESNPMLMGETMSIWLQGIEQQTVKKQGQK